MRNIIVLLDIFLIVSCGSTTTSEDSKNSGTDKTQEEKSQNINEKVSAKLQAINKWPAEPEKSLPHTDNTNFDNYTPAILISDSLRAEAGLNSLVNPATKLYYRYTLDLSPDFSTVIVTFLPNEHEIKTLLINLSNNQVIDYVQIAYDEIAEACFRTSSLITKEKLEIYKSDYCFDGGTDTIFTRIDVSGKVKKE